MEKKALVIEYREYTESLPEGVEALCRMAVEATKGSYSPYSHFAVGAAVLLDNGETVTGANQENAAYPSGTCAERTALFYAQAAYPEAKVKALAIAAFKDGVQTDDVVTPCGACRQVMAEVVYRHGDFEVLLMGRRRTVGIRASDLLPFSFHAGQL